MNEAIQELIQMLQDVAPKIWEVFMRQVMVNTIMYAIIFLLVSAGLILYIKYMQSIWESQDTEDKIYLTSGVIVFLLVWVPLVVAIVGRTYNPEYYAIMLLINGGG